jgi:hypothetical protein
MYTLQEVNGSVWLSLYVFPDDNDSMNVSVLLDGEESSLEFLDTQLDQVMTR